VFPALANVDWDRGKDPRPTLDQAQAAFQQAIVVAPGQAFGYDNVGEVHAQRALFQQASGEDPSKSVNDAVEMLERAIEKIPNHPTFRADLAMAYTVLAGYQLDHGRDPRPSLDAADKALHELDQNSSDAQVALYRAETMGLRARLAARGGRGDAGAFERAAQAFEQAIALAPENLDHALVFVRFCRAWAIQRGSGGDPEPALQRGLQLTERVLAGRPGSPDALVLQASLTLARARHTGDVAAQRAQADRARQAFTAAITINHTLNHTLEKVWADEIAAAEQLAR
jgi:eukaryotic-like serine/threonine-protein kinase